MLPVTNRCSEICVHGLLPLDHGLFLGQEAILGCVAEPFFGEAFEALEKTDLLDGCGGLEQGVLQRHPCR